MKQQPIQKPHPEILTHTQLMVADAARKRAALPKNVDLMGTLAGKLGMLKVGESLLWHSSKSANAAAKTAGVVVATNKVVNVPGFWRVERAK